MKIFKGLGGFRLGFLQGKEGEPRVISLWEPRDERRRLANVFTDELAQLTPEQQNSITKEELEQRFVEFKKAHPIQEDEDRGFLTLYLVHIEALTRAINHRFQITNSGGTIPENDVPEGRVAGIFYRLYEGDQNFWPQE
jgi:hypothetical protein